MENLLFKSWNLPFYSLSTALDFTEGPNACHQISLGRLQVSTSQTDLAHPALCNYRPKYLCNEIKNILKSRSEQW